MGDLKTVSFYTLGPEFTNLIDSFIKEGSFYQAYEILKDGGATDYWIRKYFNFQAQFVGDTRDDTFAIEKTEQRVDDVGKVYYYAARTLMSQMDISDDLLSLYRVKEGKDKHWDSLLQVFNKDAFFEMVGNFHLRDLYDFDPEPRKYLNGAILPNGAFVSCSVQGHDTLYPKLMVAGYSDAGDWTHDNKCIHITEGQMSGNLSNALQHPRILMGENFEISQPQIETLLKYKNVLSFYGDRDTIMGCLLDLVSYQEKMGGKFNNLSFIKKYYPHVNLPKFSREEMDEVGQCIRTSPEYSMPGILNSKFDLTENSVKEIEEDFEKHKDLIKDNELHYFYQEFLEGDNGVCHYHLDDDEFTYNVSSNQGDVVQGKKSSAKLSTADRRKLEDISRQFAIDLDTSVQLEFVISNDEVYIVQLRKLKNNPSYAHYTPPEEDIAFKGKSFCSGYTDTLSEDDVLIVDSDGDSELLLGKKALIVKEDVEFSHLLALSKTMNIPSLFATGDVTLPKRFSFNTSAKEGWVKIIK